MFLFLPPGTSETQRFSHVSKVYRNGALAWNGLVTTFLLQFSKVLTDWQFHIKISQNFLLISCLAFYRHPLQHLKLNSKGKLLHMTSVTSEHFNKVMTCFHHLASQQMDMLENRVNVLPIRLHVKVLKYLLHYFQTWRSFHYVWKIMIC